MTATVSTTPPPVTTDPAPPAPRRRKGHDNLQALGFLAPQLIGLVVFMVGPLVFAIVLSLSNWSGFGNRSWAGFDNFAYVLTDPDIRQSAINTIWFTVLQVPPMMISAFLIALMMQNAGKLKSFYRTFYFAPVVTSSVAVAAIWLWLFNPDISPLNSVLNSVGITAPDWLQDPSYIIPAFAIVSIWQGLGYQIVMFMAGLQSISPTMYEAADIDGASEVQKMFRITLPMISPTILFLSITSIISSFQIFDYIYVFLDTNAPQAGRTIVYEIVQIAFTEFNFGVASAVAVCLFVSLLVLTGLQLAAQRRWVHYTE
ncbi:sugar ABC transporter permease [Desertihabitans brevis]|uniref:Sugar ABC transporter permease n=1 Tax=Desertihabitans brevis TaxID=2268447 RepID=A0A367YYL2_9ACTN|nr:sugar ABC transporter permease [Desertihabitans brevis]RCK71003.1 sugar ABC transporter permease [Desertihabitans brevis]